MEINMPTQWPQYNKTKLKAMAQEKAASTDTPENMQARADIYITPNRASRRAAAKLAKKGKAK